jgi:ribosomal protein L18E
MPLQRRIPKRGFKNIHRVAYQVVNVRDLSRIEAGEVTPEILKQSGLINTLNQPVKILGTGEIEGAYQVSAHRFSGSAREKIEGAGGTVTVLAGAEEEPAPTAKAAKKQVAKPGKKKVAKAAEASAPAAEETVEAPAPEGEGASEAEEEKA